MLYVGHALWHFLFYVALFLYTYSGFGVCLLTACPTLLFWFLSTWLQLSCNLQILYFNIYKRVLNVEN